MTTVTTLPNSDDPYFMRGYKAGLDAALNFVIGYPAAWKADHRVIELQEDVVDETCDQIEAAIKQYAEQFND